MSLKRCLELLSELRQGIETTGFQQECDTAVLQKLYGTATYSPDRFITIMATLHRNREPSSKTSCGTHFPTGLGNARVRLRIAALSLAKVVIGLLKRMYINL